MNDHAAATLLGPDDLQRLPDNELCELIDGRVAEKHMGGESSYVGGEIAFKLKEHLKAHPGGWVLPADAGYRCFPGRPKLVRKPDVSLIRFGRLPGERLPKGDIPLAPDLAVEVVSPNDLYDEIDRKVSDYLDVGVPLVWVINPEARTVVVYRPDGSARRLRDGGDLDGGDVLPGFRCPVADLFPPPAPAQGAAEPSA
jgi:Uma2 family endonuclease